MNETENLFGEYLFGLTRAGYRVMGREIVLI